MKPPTCAECRAGEVYDVPAVALVSVRRAADDRRVREYVCEQHLEMLTADDEALKILKRVRNG